METAEQKAAKEINQKHTIINIDGIDFKVKPLTLGQIFDISAEISKLKDISSDEDGKDILTVMIQHIDDLKIQLEVALIVLFRKEEDREANRKFIRENLDEELITSLQELYVDRLNSPFFLTNIIFLKGLNLMKPTKTIAHGQ